ncbi:pyrophosphatase PpaX [Desmospora profundinema]|uniref:Pyrophosphatase PpaX n=1 Tax=Desmospora profundinema TaxID=1571184 RepID=A0ABU1IMI7_9BACL|nr:pyrophosphatase PpaX [Desmospora profundinema]MDR6225618.1 pyrophosphatase PpaX [Desmospora profundinema]
MKYPVILFDLDGTLLDTTSLILASFRHTLDEHGPFPYGDKEVLASLGEPLHDQMRRFGGEERVETMVQTYREHNVAHHDDYVKAFPGVNTVLETLHREGFLLGVVSNKQRMTVEMGLNLCGLASMMATVVCQGEADRDKPAPDPIRLALSRIGADPASALMVGDSRYDLLAAKKAGTASAGVAWSAHGAESLKAYEPDYLLDRMEDLYDIVGLAGVDGSGRS